MKNLKLRKSLVLLLCLCMTATMFLASCGSKDPVEESAMPHNSLTGMTEEEGYDTSADDQRVAAFVVENAPDARPQWGMDDANYSPDIFLQGEVEGGITRTLWLYADYNKLPEVIGPMRSARPPYVKFSELFDAVFLHWGKSHSKGSYTGASTVFRKDKVDHIDQMTYSGETDLYDRDHTRNVSSEHTGIIYGDKVAEAIKGEGFRKEPNDYTKLCFNKAAAPVSDQAAVNVGVKYSSKAFEDSYWTYNEEDGLYHTSDFENDFTRDNLLVLYDKTEYITKENYAGPGSAGSVTYCDYKLDGGKGQLFSKGTVKDIEWKVEDGKLILIDPETDLETAMAANEEAFKAAKEAKAETYEKPYMIAGDDEEEGEEADAEDAAEGDAYVVQPLNKGKTWIGWISSNNGGKVSIS